ncbi:MAG: recombinase zinc beta ribbon domain-containing protein, partial [Planctomycetes bacterium]|nr:recombinase zinc beta ribbon domain-containing protein [Planctomycetota bacterium]
MPVIIAPEVFARAQEIADARPNIASSRTVRTTQPGIRTGHRGLLQGLIECGICGRGLRVVSDTRRGSRAGGQQAEFEHVYVCAGRVAPSGSSRCELPRLNG